MVYECPLGAHFFVEAVEPVAAGDKRGVELEPMACPTCTKRLTGYVPPMWVRAVWWM